MKKQTSRKTHKRPYVEDKNKLPEIDQIIKKIMTSNEHGKTIAIEDLPNCEHKTKLLQFANGDAHICVVAERIKNTNEWICYAGYPDLKDTWIMQPDDDILWNCEHIRDATSVVMLGTTLEKEAAHILFPDWDIDEYYKPRY